MSIRISIACIKYFMCYLTGDVISCCVWSFDVGKINVQLNPKKVSHYQMIKISY